MTTNLTDSRSTVIRRILGGLLVLVLVAIGTADRMPGASAQPGTAERAYLSSHARTAARHGVGLTIAGQWVGSWRLPEGHGFCVDFSLGHPDSTGARLLGRGRVRGMSREQSARAALVATRYARTRSATDAAAAALVVWRLQHTHRFDRFYARMIARRELPGRVRAAVRRIEREARRHGPYRMSLSIGTGTVGQFVDGAARLRQGGRALRSVPVRLLVAPTAVLVRSAHRTDRRGLLRFRLRVAHPGAVRVRASASLPSTNTVLISKPTRGRQHLIVAGPARRVEARASSVRSLSAPRVVAVCDADCHGVARVRVSAANPCGAAMLRVFTLRDGRLARDGSFDVAGCRRGAVTVSAADGVTVTTRYCYLDARRRCSTAMTRFPGQLKVECPPRLEFRFSGGCPCPGSTSIAYAVRAPASSHRHYRARLTVEGRVAELSVRNGGWQSFAPIAMRAGATVELSYEVLGQRVVLSRFQLLA